MGGKPSSWLFHLLHAKRPWVVIGGILATVLNHALASSVGVGGSTDFCAGAAAILRHVYWFRVDLIPDTLDEDKQESRGRFDDGGVIFWRKWRQSAVSDSGACGVLRYPYGDAWNNAVFGRSCGVLGDFRTRGAKALRFVAAGFFCFRPAIA